MKSNAEWVLVTGGAKGLGAEICKTLAKAGYSIAIHFNRSREEAENVKVHCLSLGAQAEIIQGRFSSESLVSSFIENALKRFSISHLVNNVGNYLNQPLLNTTSEEWQALFQVNFHAPVALMQAFSPSIARAKGSIVNIGVSGLQAQQAKVVNTPYGITKSSLWTATKALSRELVTSKVRVNMVSPGQLENSSDKPTNLTVLPMGRLGTLTETARVVAFLIAPESAYITGQNIDIAGGI